MLLAADDTEGFAEGRREVMTILRISEGPKNEQQTEEIEETDLDSSSGDRGDGGLHRDWRKRRYASVELAGAGVVRIAAGYLLAGYRTAGSLPNSFRRLRS